MECSHVEHSVKIGPQLIHKIRTEKASHWTCSGEYADRNENQNLGFNVWTLVKGEVLIFEVFIHSFSLPVYKESLDLPQMWCYQLWKVQINTTFA